MAEFFSSALLEHGIGLQGGLDSAPGPRDGDGSSLALGLDSRHVEQRRDWDVPNLGRAAPSTTRVSESA